MVLTEALMDRPRFRTYFLHPRFWPLWLGLGLLWLIVQLPFRVLLVIGRLLTDADFRRRVEQDGSAYLVGLRTHGVDLSREEVAALIARDPRL